MKNKIAPIHPGEILLEEFLKPMEITQYRLSKDLDLPISRINQIVLSKRAITASTALLLSKYFNLSEEFWLNLQNRFDLETAKDKMKVQLQSIKVVTKAA